jgi:hypothetical protein
MQRKKVHNSIDGLHIKVKTYHAIDNRVILLAQGQFKPRPRTFLSVGLFWRLELTAQVGRDFLIQTKTSLGDNQPLLRSQERGFVCNKISNFWFTFSQKVIQFYKYIVRGYLKIRFTASGLVKNRIYCVSDRKK